MLKADRSELDYSTLVKKARRPAPTNGQKLKLALLADVSTQHLVPVLKALFASNATDVEVYEAGYDTIELEAYDADSELYAFRPDVVVILQSLMKLKAAFYDFQGAPHEFVTARAEKMVGVWRAIQSRCPASVVQSTFVLPYERPYGNFGLRAGGTLHEAVNELNREVCRRAREFPAVFINDIDHLAAWVGRRHFLDEKLYALAKSLCALEFLPDVAQNIVDIALASRGRAVKCVVLDLDNTLWGGVVGDDGLDGIALGDLDDGDSFRFFQYHLRELARRGVLLAVCSKNDEALARRVFREHPGMILKEEHIAAFVANWDDKAANIRRIQQQLNIGFDSMVFLDDNPFERNLVRQLIPGIIVPELPEDPALYVRAISELNLFETASHSALDRQRAELYQDQQRRDTERASFSDIREYLQSLDTLAILAPFVPGNLRRIAQLIQRSNQFNLTTRRYSEAECEAIMRDDPNTYAFTLTVKDRFGDFGLINVVILRRHPEALEIDTFLMSCRVLQRGVEQLAMNKIFEYARAQAHSRVVGRYIPTAKNGMVKDFYRQFGFTQSPGANGYEQEWTLAVADYQPREVFIKEYAAAETPSLAASLS